jgi:hypothetical protein
VDIRTSEYQAEKEIFIWSPDILVSCTLISWSPDTRPNQFFLFSIANFAMLIPQFALAI